MGRFADERTCSIHASVVVKQEMVAETENKATNARLLRDSTTTIGESIAGNYTSLASRFAC